MIAPSAAQIRDALGVPVTFALSDQPWSFRVASADDGEPLGVTVWVAEHPDTVTVTVIAETQAGVRFRSEQSGAQRLSVSRDDPQIVVDFAHDGSATQLLITLRPTFRIEERRSNSPVT